VSKTDGLSSIAAKLSTVVVTAISAVALSASPAAAAHDDYMFVETTDVCGSADFIDWGQGAPGGGDNDDYIDIDDDCGDGKGVKAWAWLNGTALGSKYHGAGAHTSVTWDPFAARGNVSAGDRVGIKVCLVDGSSDPTPTRCAEKSMTSVDG
jgi:hypothetical protein